MRGNQHAGGVGSKAELSIEVEASIPPRFAVPGEPVLLLFFAAKGQDRVHHQRALHADKAAESGSRRVRFPASPPVRTQRCSSRRSRSLRYSRPRIPSVRFPGDQFFAQTRAWLKHSRITGEHGHPRTGARFGYQQLLLGELLKIDQQIINAGESGHARPILARGHNATMAGNVVRLSAPVGGGRRRSVFSTRKTGASRGRPRWPCCPPSCWKWCLYFTMGVERLRLRLEKLPPAGVAVALVIGAVTPYTLATLAVGHFSWHSLGVIAALAVVAAFWYVVFPRANCCRHHCS